MPHDDPRQHWHEVLGEAQKAGKGSFIRAPQPYDRYMLEQDIPIFRDIGISKVQNLPLKPWARTGGRGSFIQLFGTEGLWGCYVIEVPGAGALNAEKHMYEEIFLVIEGRGTTEVWQDGDTRKHVFEWQKGSMFSIPLNTNHRIVNATTSPALMLAGTTAPTVFNQVDNWDFVFNCPFRFSDRFNGAADFYKPNDEVEPDPIRGLAMRRTNLIVDVMNTELPLDNRRSPGSRRIEPSMTGNKFYLWIGEHQTGRYSKAHGHSSGPVLICLKGKGYTHTWPAKLGPRPWESGHADQVRRVDYEPVGLVTAAPMASDWYHQHFAVSAEPLRLTAWYGMLRPGLSDAGIPGQKAIDYGAIDIRDGGTAIPYDEEDPAIRRDYEAALKANGMTSRMDPSLYVMKSPA
jgi:mannose-6-phosphate isomerase-like protein (cupin superfamily)